MRKKKKIMIMVARTMETTGDYDDHANDDADDLRDGEEEAESRITVGAAAPHHLKPSS